MNSAATNSLNRSKKAHFENRLPDKCKVLAKYKMLMIDAAGYLPMDIQGANLLFQLIARRYKNASTVFTSNKTFSQWNDVFAACGFVFYLANQIDNTFNAYKEIDDLSQRVTAVLIWQNRDNLVFIPSQQSCTTDRPLRSKPTAALYKAKQLLSS